jgi:hypothetical protein
MSHGKFDADRALGCSRGNFDSVSWPPAQAQNRTLISRPRAGTRAAKSERENQDGNTTIYAVCALARSRRNVDYDVGTQAKAQGNQVTDNRGIN